MDISDGRLTASIKTVWLLN